MQNSWWWTTCHTRLLVFCCDWVYCRIYFYFLIAFLFYQCVHPCDVPDCVTANKKEEDRCVVNLFLTDTYGSTDLHACNYLYRLSDSYYKYRTLLLKFYFVTDLSNAIISLPRTNTRIIYWIIESSLTSIQSAYIYTSRPYELGTTRVTRSHYTQRRQWWTWAFWNG